MRPVKPIYKCRHQQNLQRESSLTEKKYVLLGTWQWSPYSIKITCQPGILMEAVASQLLWKNQLHPIVH